MSAFAVVRCPDCLERVCADLTAFNRHQAGRAGHVRREPFLGIWIERDHSSAPAQLQTPSHFAGGGDVRLSLTTEVGGTWALCLTESPRVTRDALLSALLASRACQPPFVGGRFLPVFGDASREESEAEWRQLATRYRNRVLPPLYEQGTGALDLGNIDWAERLMSRDSLRT